jgi:hypothetical protein
VSSRVSAGWIVGPWFDGVFFFGSAVIAAVAGLAMLASPSVVAPFWWAWLLLIDGPHLLATYTRTYLDPAEWRRQKVLLLASLIWLLPGFVALVATRVSGSSIAFDLFLLAATVWGWHHNLRQSYGVSSIYARHAGVPMRWARRDGRLLQIALWSMFGLFLVGHPMNRAILGLPRELERSGRVALIVAGVTLAMVLVGYIIVRVIATRGQPRRALWFLLGPVLALQAFALFVIGAGEPLFPAPQNPEQMFLAVAVVGGVVHGTHYLGIVFATNRRRHAAAPASAPLLAHLATRPLLAWAVFVVVSLGYVAINAARGTSPSIALFPGSSDAGRAFAALYFGLFFHHYYIDQKIWRPGRDARLRTELGLEAGT